ncbi:hypothetical protein [Acaryochloris marina]|nr:hypothetical protein [Acaryochloris marina]
MNNKPRALTLAERSEQHQMTSILQRCLQQAIHLDDPVPALHDSLQLIEDMDIFQDFDWQIIENALEDVLQNRQTIQGAASIAALEITGLSIQHRL